MNLHEIWQVEVNDQIYEANVEELCRWIARGALLPADKVRRSDLRWLETRKVPLLNEFFNAPKTICRFLFCKLSPRLRRLTAMCNCGRKIRLTPQR